VVCCICGVMVVVWCGYDCGVKLGCGCVVGLVVGL